MPRQALVREVHEELSIVLQAGDLEPVSFAEEAGEPSIVLLLYRSERWQGQVVAQEGQQWAWHERAAAARLDLAPMDSTLLAGLRF